jgi:uncharacterized damage-inducible protein DinB
LTVHLEGLVAADRNELIEAINEAHERFFAALVGFDDTMLETQPICGKWSARDVAGHLADWHNEIIDALERTWKKEPQRRPIRDIDAWNQDQAALRGIDTWNQASEDLRVAWKRVIDTLDGLTENDLDRVAPLPTGTVEPVRSFFRRRIARHTRTHAEDAEAWRMRLLGVRERDE